MNNLTEDSLDTCLSYSSGQGVSSQEIVSLLQSPEGAFTQV